MGTTKGGGSVKLSDMVKPDDRYHLYVGCYADLILGCGIALCYIQAGDRLRFIADFFESATINALDLSALTTALEFCLSKAPYTVYTNNRYISTAMLHAGNWRNQGIIEERAHPHLITQMLGHMDQLGEGEIQLSMRKSARDPLMLHLLKYAKHLYYKAQMQMIEKRTTDLPTNLFTSEIWDIKDLPGSILWRTPLSVGEFQKKMAQSRLTQQQPKDEKPFLKLVQ